MSSESVTAGAVALPAVVVLRSVCPDYGRAPRGRPAWQGLILVIAALLTLLGFTRGWL